MMQIKIVKMLGLILFLNCLFLCNTSLASANSANVLQNPESCEVSTSPLTRQVTQLRDTLLQANSDKCYSTEEMKKKANEVSAKVDYIPNKYLANACGARALFLSLELLAEGIPNVQCKVGYDQGRNGPPDGVLAPNLTDGTMFMDHIVACLPPQKSGGTPIIIDQPFSLEATEGEQTMPYDKWISKLNPIPSKKSAELRLQTLPTVTPPRQQGRNGPPLPIEITDPLVCGHPKDDNKVSLGSIIFQCKLLYENLLKEGRDAKKGEEPGIDRAKKLEERINLLASKLGEKKIAGYKNGQKIDCKPNVPKFNLDPNKDFTFYRNNNGPQEREEIQILAVSKDKPNQREIIRTITRPADKPIVQRGVIDIPLSYENIDLITPYTVFDANKNVKTDVNWKILLWGVKEISKDHIIINDPPNREINYLREK